MKYRCPVCMFAALPYAPSDYNICPCCSTEFGNDDADFSHVQLRDMWIATGAAWFFGRPPEHWNPWMQLLNADRGIHMPKILDAGIQGLSFGRSTSTVQFLVVSNSAGADAFFNNLNVGVAA
jgi:hypothetical protein